MLAQYIQALINKNGIPPKVEQIVAYCLLKENGRVFEDWAKEVIESMVTYHIVKKTIITKYDDKGDIIGVLMWYNCDYNDGWDFIKNWEPDKEDGDTVFLAFLFADGVNVMKSIVLDLIAQEPDILTKKIISIRPRGGLPTRVEYSLKFFQKILKSHG
jgi:hypothetical protein